MVLSIDLIGNAHNFLAAIFILKNQWYIFDPNTPDFATRLDNLYNLFLLSQSSALTFPLGDVTSMPASHNEATLSSTTSTTPQPAAQQTNEDCDPSDFLLDLPSPAPTYQHPISSNNDAGQLNTLGANVHEDDFLA